MQTKIKFKIQEYRNHSHLNSKVSNTYTDNDEEDAVLSGTASKQQSERYHNSIKKKNKQTNGQKKNNSPLKLDKNLKSIENRILQKMKNKREGIAPQTKIPSLERISHPLISYGK